MQFSRFCLWNSFLVTAQQEKQSKSADKKQRHSDEKPSEWHFAIRYEITGWRPSMPFRA